MTKDREKDEALSAWRKSNWEDIMDKNRKVLESIRDNSETSAREVVNACVALARMVDGISPEKITTSKAMASAKADAAATRDLTDDEKAMYEQILNGINPPTS